MRILPTLIGAVAMALSGALLAAGGDDPAPARSAAYSKGVDLLEAKNFAGSVEHLKKAVAENPEDADAWNYLGFAYRHTGKLDDSLAAYEKALSLAPEHRGAHEYLGELYLQMGDVARAEEMLHKLDSLCFFPCEEQRDLDKAIKKFKAG